MKITNLEEIIKKTIILLVHQLI